MNINIKNHDNIHDVAAIATLQSDEGWVIVGAMQPAHQTVAPPRNHTEPEARDLPTALHLRSKEAYSFPVRIQWGRMAAVWTRLGLRVSSWGALGRRGSLCWKG